ncbi:MAG: hypothetical protein LC790_13095 [Actinobacteria bacterium]|nr:hypothetical protein [Actinomycetota bacterium]
MSSTADKQTITAAYVGCAAAAGYAALKAAWALGGTLGVRDGAVFDAFVDDLGGPLVAMWATILLALLAAAILLSLVHPWGERLPRRLRASLAWMGALLAPLGLIGLGHTVFAAISGEPFPMLTPEIYIAVYASFTVLGLSFAFTAWRSEPHTAHRPLPQGASS